MKKVTFYNSWRKIDAFRKREKEPRYKKLTEEINAQKRMKMIYYYGRLDGNYL